MGRKGHFQRAVQPVVKGKRPHNLTAEDKELRDNVDKLLRLSTIPQQISVVKALETQREISQLLEKITSLEQKNNIQSPSITDDRTAGAIIDNFMKWLVKNGAELKGCKIANFQGYDLGIKVEENISKGKLVIAVPRKLMLTTEHASHSMLKKMMETDHILKNMPNVTLAIFLLVEKFSDKSFWKPYIDILPKSYTTVMYFNVEELEELKGSPTLETALRQVKSIARQYAYFHKLFNTSQDAVSLLMRNRFTYSEYCWAVSTVMTRQNTIPSKDGCNMINALIPLWDFCNHTNGTISTDFNPELDRSECLAHKHFNAGEQLFIFYGPRSNADLFIHNGFVYEENANDCYWLRLGISRSDPLQEKRSELLRKLSLSNTNEFSIKKGQDIDRNLLAFLRIFNMNEEQLQHWLESDKSGDLEYMECALDTVLEKKSWSFLLTRLRLLLAAYKTTLEDDLKLLQENSVTPNTHLAIRMRATEKKIIVDTIEKVEQYIKQ